MFLNFCSSKHCIAVCLTNFCDSPVRYPAFKPKTLSSSITDFHYKVITAINSTNSVILRILRFLDVCALMNYCDFDFSNILGDNAKYLFFMKLRKLLLLLLCKREKKYKF